MHMPHAKTESAFVSHNEHYSDEQWEHGMADFIDR